MARVSWRQRDQFVLGAGSPLESPAEDLRDAGADRDDAAEEECGEPAQENGPLNHDGFEEPQVEIAAILATGYLRLRLGNAPDATTTDVSPSCGGEESDLQSDIPLDEAERKSVHVGDGINDEKRPGARRASHR